MWISVLSRVSTKLCTRIRKKGKYLHSLKVHWPSLMSRQNNRTEASQVLQPPTGLRSLVLQGYPGVSLPSWFKPLPSTISFASIGVFSSLMELTISSCQNLSSLEHFLHPAYVPAIKNITIKKRFVDLHCLEELEVVHYPNICSQSFVSPSLKRLVLGNSGNLGDNIECCSLTKFFVYYSLRTSTPLQHMPSLQSLDIVRCESLMFVRPAVFTNLSHCGCSAGSIKSFSSLTVIYISGCIKLSTLDDLLIQEFLPAIEKTYVAHCGELLSLPGGRFGSFLCLKDLEVYDCPVLNWQRGLVLPSMLERLFLGQCGDISACIPSCLQNLAPLILLEISECQHIISIPGDVWSRKLSSLEQLYFRDCPDLVSIGGLEAVAKLKTLHVFGCLKMKELNQPLWRDGI